MPQPQNSRERELLNKSAYLRGFTLVEMSITLMTVALIVGGVIVGRDLIKAAEVRQQVTQIDNVNAAVMAFRLKYNCLSGDCRNATQFFSASTQPDQVTNGNGNGMICGYATGSACNLSPNHIGTWQNILTNGRGDCILAWDHLAVAGLLDLQPFDETDMVNRIMPGIGMPKLNVNSSGVNGNLADHVWRQGGITIGFEAPYFYHNGGHVLKLGACPHRELNASYAEEGTLGFDCALNPSEARAIDTKVDDGKPYSGKAVVMAGDSSFAHNPYRINGSASGDRTTSCGTYAINEYKSDAAGMNSMRGCNFSIIAPF